MDKKIIFSLYRHKLRRCALLGYKYGNWDNNIVCRQNDITRRKLRKLYKNNCVGHFLFNNFRHHYKIGAHANNEQKDVLIDYGFHILKTLNFALASEFH